MRTSTARARRPCAVCGAAATFHTPRGYLCDEHTMMVVTDAVENGDNGWIPIRVGLPSSGRAHVMSA